MNIRNNAKSTEDSYYSLINEFKNDTSNNCIILSAFKETLSLEELKDIYDKVIIYNLENYWESFCKLPKYVYFLKNADDVWDYDEENIKHLSYLRNDNIHLHLLKPFIKIPSKEKEYDVLFYGMLTDRRKKIIESLINDNINVKVITNLYGNELNDYISKSKCYVNIHKHEKSLQEQARLIRLKDNITIFSEKSINNYLNVNEYEYNELVPAIKTYLSNYE